MPRRLSGSTKEKAELGSIRFAEVTKSTYGDFTKLFEAKGGPSYCWCMAWRPLEGRREDVSNEDRKKGITALVKSAVPVGILAYADKEPIGWCSVAPRETYRTFSPDQDDGEKDVWSIACFYVPRSLRGAGLGPRLLDAAVKHAFTKGAKAVEAYPVDQDSPSYRFMGFRPMFEVRGFHETGRAGSRRHVMRLEKG